MSSCIEFHALSNELCIARDRACFKLLFCPPNVDVARARPPQLGRLPRDGRREIARERRKNVVVLCVESTQEDERTSILLVLTCSFCSWGFGGITPPFEGWGTCVAPLVTPDQRYALRATLGQCRSLRIEHAEQRMGHHLVALCLLFRLIRVSSGKTLSFLVFGAP